MRYIRAVLAVVAIAAPLTGFLPWQPVVVQASAPRFSAYSAGPQVLTDFELNASESPDLAHRLHSGVPVSMLWVLQTRLVVRGWRDAPGPRATVRVAAQPRLDGQGFLVTEVVNGVLDRTFTRDIDGTVIALTSFTRMPAFRCEALPGTRYTVAIRAILDGGGAPRLETATLATTTFPRENGPPNIGVRPTADRTRAGRCG